MTEWKVVTGHPNYYVSSEGELYNKKTKNFLKGHVKLNSYVKVKLNSKTYLLHRLIAEHFIPNPDNKKEVNHKGHIIVFL